MTLYVLLINQSIMERDRIKEFTNLYSMGLLPKIEGRYLTGPKPKSKLYLAKFNRSNFSMEHARNRLKMQLKRIQLSQRIVERSQRNSQNRSFCKTEPVEQSIPLAKLNTIRIQAIEINSPKSIAYIKQPVSLARPSPASLLVSQICTENISISKMASAERPSNSPSVMKAKFGKKPFQEQKQEGRVSPEGGQTIGRWVSSMHAEITQNHFELYGSDISKDNTEMFKDAVIFENQKEYKGFTLHHIAIKKLQKSKRQFLFRNTRIVETQ